MDIYVVCKLDENGDLQFVATESTNRPYCALTLESAIRFLDYFESVSRYLNKKDTFVIVKVNILKGEIV